MRLNQWDWSSEDKIWLISYIKSHCKIGIPSCTSSILPFCTPSGFECSPSEADVCYFDTAPMGLRVIFASERDGLYFINTIFNIHPPMFWLQKVSSYWRTTGKFNQFIPCIIISKPISSRSYSTLVIYCIPIIHSTILFTIFGIIVIISPGRFLIFTN